MAHRFWVVSISNLETRLQCRARLPAPQRVKFYLVGMALYLVKGSVAEKVGQENQKQVAEAEAKQKKRSQLQKIGDAIGEFFNALPAVVSAI